MKNTNFKVNVYLGISLVVMSFFLNSCQKEIGVSALESTVINSSPPAFVGGNPGEEYVPNQVLVKFKTGTTDTRINAIFSNMAANVEEKIHTNAMKRAGDANGIFLLNLPMAALNAIQDLLNLPEVEYAEPNYIYTHHATATDPLYTNGSLWGMKGSYGTNAEIAWGAGHTGGKEVYIAVIDEGIMNTHEDLTSNCWINPFDKAGDGIDNDGNGYKDDTWGWDFVNNDRTTYDGIADDHATHVAGTIGALANNKGVVGMNWDVKMISCKFLGSRGGTLSNAIKAVDYVTDLKTRNGLNIVATNNSWGGGGYSQLLLDAIVRANSAEILFIAAAGNSGTNNDVTPSYPSNYISANVIAVAAINSAGGLSSFSQYGATTVHIGAPGENIFSTIPVKGRIPSGYGSYNGTSMATPHVSGAAALYASTRSVTTAAQIKAAILAAATPTPSLIGKCVSGGRLDVKTF